MSTSGPAGSSASQGSSQAERTGLVVSGGASAGWSPPLMRYHSVDHGEASSEVETSSEPSHLMLAMPTQPGSTSRTGKPWSGARSSPLTPQTSRASSRAFSTGNGRRTGPRSMPASQT